MPQQVFGRMNLFILPKSHHYRFFVRFWLYRIIDQRHLAVLELTDHRLCMPKNIFLISTEDFHCRFLVPGNTQKNSCEDLTPVLTYLTMMVKIYAIEIIFIIIFMSKLVSNLRNHFLCIAWHQKPRSTLNMLVIFYWNFL